MRSLLLEISKICRVLFLLGAWALSAQLAEAQQQTLTGWFTITVADYPTESGLTSEITYALTEDSGERHELLIDIELMKPLGGPVALNRKRVTVMGEWEQIDPDVPAHFRVNSIELNVLPLAALPGRTFAFESSPDETATLASSVQAAVTGSQAWVTILCRFADATDVTPHPVSWYEGMLGSSYPGLEHYWREVSYGTITDLAGSVVVGWYNLPRPRSYYLYIDEDGREDFETDRAVEDCTVVADADVFFPDFDGINLIFNQQGDAERTVSRGGSRRLTKDGQTQFYGVTWIHPRHNASVVAHEMGHAFGLLHSSGPYDETYDSEWDVMSGGGTCLFRDPEYGCVGVHTIAYHKDFLGWIPPVRKYVFPPNSTHTITLERLALPGPEGYRLAQIPIGESPTDFYTVEARLFAGYDDAIPDEAIVIHKVDTTREDRLAQVVDVDNNGDPNDEGAMWTVGEIFTDQENALQVSIDAAYASGYRVTINTNPATFSTCIDFLSSSSHLFGPGRDNASVQVEAASDCDWSARSNTEWIRVTSGGTGSGSGSVRYTVAANPSPAARTGTLTIGEWTFTVTQTSTHNIFFADDMEDGASDWSPGQDSPWALTTTSSRSGSSAWTDSPAGNYQNDLSTGLWSSRSLPIDLTEVDSATLTFWHRYDFASGDKGNVWVAREQGDGGWRTEELLRTFTGTQSTWQQVSLDLTPFVGEPIRLAFYLKSDASETADGWYIDDIIVFSPDSVAYDTCTHSVSPTRQVFGPREGIASVEVEAPRGCHWGAKSNSLWLRVTAGSSGSGTGKVSYSFAANPRSTARTGTLTVAGRTVRVTQVRVKEVLFEDDMESGINGWSGGASWALTTTSAHSGTRAWTDSPRGNYQNDLNTSLWSSSSSPIDLPEVDAALLTFWHRYDFGRGDRGNVWVARQREDGSWWTEEPLLAFTGTQSTWEQVSLDLSPFVGGPISLVFQLLSDASQTADGWYIDDMVVFTSAPVVPAETRVGFESPEAGPVAGIGVIQGWAFAEQPGVTIRRVDLVIDGEVVTDIPCCSERRDIEAAFPTFPSENTQHSGWGLTYNWGNLSAGPHAVQVKLHTTEGTVVPTAVRPVVVVKPGGFAFLDRFDLSGAAVALDGRELVVSGAVVRDKATQQEREVVTLFRWATSRQGFSLVGTEPSATLAAGASPWARLLAFLPERLLGWMAPAGAQAAPGLVTTFEGPKAGQRVSGIGLVNGWGFAEGPGERIEAVRLVVDGQAWGTIPCCSTRGDVAAHFPALPQALNSGWGLTFNYGLLPSGSHTFEVQLEASSGEVLSRTHPVTVVRVGEFAFLDQFDLSGATVRLAGEEIVLTGVRIRDKASQQGKRVTVRVRWFEGRQGLGIVAAHDEAPVAAEVE